MKNRISLEPVLKLFPSRKISKLRAIFLKFAENSELFDKNFRKTRTNLMVLQQDNNFKTGS